MPLQVDVLLTATPMPASIEYDPQRHLWRNQTQQTDSKTPTTFFRHEQLYGDQYIRHSLVRVKVGASQAIQIISLCICRIRQTLNNTCLRNSKETDDGPPSAKRDGFQAIDP